MSVWGRTSKIDVNIRIVDNVNDLGHVMKHHGSWYRSWAQERMEEGNLCFGADYNGKIISTVWTSFDHVFLPYVEYNLNAREGIIPLIGGWSSPDFRGQGIYPSVWNECCKFLIEKKNAKRTWAFIQPTNIISFIVHKKFFCDRVDMIIQLKKLFGFRKHRVIHPFRPIDDFFDL